MSHDSLARKPTCFSSCTVLSVLVGVSCHWLQLVSTPVYINLKLRPQLLMLRTSATVSTPFWALPLCIAAFWRFPLVANHGNHSWTLNLLIVLSNTLCATSQCNECILVSRCSGRECVLSSHKTQPEKSKGCQATSSIRNLVEIHRRQTVSSKQRPLLKSLNSLLFCFIVLKQIDNS